MTISYYLGYLLTILFWFGVGAAIGALDSSLSRHLAKSKKQETMNV